jgi:cell wall-associated NlpC family hydrolase
MSIHFLPRIVALSACCVIAQTAVAQERPSTTPASPGKSVVTIQSTIDGEDVIRTARKYLGVPYVLGGSTPRSFDCSGFVRWVYAQHGIQLPRTAREQAALGEPPRAGDPLQPGDLLFFHGGNGAQHIAMYVGRDTIIHASSRSKRVKLDRFSGRYRPNSSWFGERLIAVRRLLPAEGVFHLPTSSAPSASDSASTELEGAGARVAHAGRAQTEP